MRPRRPTDAPDDLVKQAVDHMVQMVH